MIDKIKIKDVQKNEGEGHSSTPLSSPGKSIITFYSDRNLNVKMRWYANFMSPKSSRMLK